MPALQILGSRCKHTGDLGHYYEQQMPIGAR